jgi:hypothetical protein
MYHCDLYIYMYKEPYHLSHVRFCRSRQPKAASAFYECPTGRAQRGSVNKILLQIRGYANKTLVGERTAQVSDNEQQVDDNPYPASKHPFEVVAALANCNEISKWDRSPSSSSSDTMSSHGAGPVPDMSRHQGPPPASVTGEPHISMKPESTLSSTESL